MLSECRKLTSLILLLAYFISNCKTTNHRSTLNNNAGVNNFQIGYPVDTSLGLQADRNCLAEINAGTYYIPQTSTAKTLPSAKLIFGTEDLGATLQNDTAFRLTPIDILSVLGYGVGVESSAELTAIANLPVGQYTPLLAVTYSESRRFRTIKSIRLARQYIEMLKEGRYSEFIKTCGTGLVAAEEEGSYFVSLTLLDIWGQRNVPQEKSGSAMYRAIVEGGLSGGDPTVVYTKLDRFVNGDGTLPKKSVILSFTQGKRPTLKQGKFTGQELATLWSQFIEERNRIWVQDSIGLVDGSTHLVDSSKGQKASQSQRKQTFLATGRNPGQQQLIQSTINERITSPLIQQKQIEVPELAKVPLESRIQMLMQKVKSSISNELFTQNEPIAELPTEQSNLVFHRNFVEYSKLGLIPLSDEHALLLENRSDFIKLLVTVALETKGKIDARNYALSQKHQFDALNSDAALDFIRKEGESLDSIKANTQKLFETCQRNLEYTCDLASLEKIQQQLSTFDKPQQSDPIEYGEWDFCPISQYNAVQDPICGIAAYQTCEHPDFGIRQYRLGSGEVCGANTWKVEHDCKKCGQKPNFGACKKCAHPSFGIASWKECRHEAFGVESFLVATGPQCGVARYAICSHPNLGVARRQSCPRAKF